MRGERAEPPDFPKITRRAISGGDALRRFYRPEALMTPEHWIPVLRGHDRGMSAYRKLPASEFDLIDRLGEELADPTYINPAVYSPQTNPSFGKKFTFKKTDAYCVVGSMLDADIHKPGGPLNSDWTPISQLEAWSRYQELVRVGFIRPGQIWIDGASSVELPGGCYILNAYKHPYLDNDGVERTAREWKILREYYFLRLRASLNVDHKALAVTQPFKAPGSLGRAQAYLICNEHGEPIAPSRRDAAEDLNWFRQNPSELDPANNGYSRMTIGQEKRYDAASDRWHKHKATGQQKGAKRRPVRSQQSRFKYCAERIEDIARFLRCHGEPTGTFAKRQLLLIVGSEAKRLGIARQRDENPSWLFIDETRGEWGEKVRSYRWDDSLLDYKRLFAEAIRQIEEINALFEKRVGGDVYVLSGALSSGGPDILRTGTTRLGTVEQPDRMNYVAIPASDSRVEQAVGAMRTDADYKPIAGPNSNSAALAVAQVAAGQAVGVPSIPAKALTADPLHTGLEETENMMYEIMKNMEPTTGASTPP